MKGDCYSFNMRYGSMICSKRLQSDRPYKRLNEKPLVQVRLDEIGSTVQVFFSLLPSLPTLLPGNGNKQTCWSSAAELLISVSYFTARPSIQSLWSVRSLAQLHRPNFGREVGSRHRYVIKGCVNLQQVAISRNLGLDLSSLYMFLS